MLKHNRWDYKSNVKYAQTAENVGFEYALTQIRFMAGYGAVSPRSEIISQIATHNFLGVPARIRNLLPSTPSQYEKAQCHCGFTTGSVESSNRSKADRKHRSLFKWKNIGECCLWMV